MATQGTTLDGAPNSLHHLGDPAGRNGTGETGGDASLEPPLADVSDCPIPTAAPPPPTPQSHIICSGESLKSLEQIGGGEGV